MTHFLVLTALALMGLDMRHDTSHRGLADEVDAYMQPYVDLGFFDGTLLIAQEGQVLYQQAYGMADYTQQLPNTLHTQFRMASVSKPFTEMAIGKLIEQGALHRKTTLSAILPGYPRGQEITIGHLLDNRSGVPHINNLPWYDQFAAQDYSLDELIEQFKNEPLAFNPGTQRAYTNGGYVLMASVIEQVSEQSYGDYVETHILQPLGMEASGHDYAGRALPYRAEGHVPGYTALDARVQAPYVEMSLKIGGGSLYSTVADLYRWDRALFEDNVLQAETYKMLFPLTDGVLAFSGRQPGFNAYHLRRLEEDVTVILLSNNYGSAMLEQMAEAFVAMVLDQPYDAPLVRTDVEISTDTLAAYAGRYQVPDGTIIEIRREGSNLVAYEDNEPQEMLVPLSETTFLLRVAWAEVTFAMNSRTTVSHATVRFLINHRTLELPRLDS